MDTHCCLHTPTQIKMVSHHNRAKETCGGGQGCHWPVSGQMSHTHCANVNIDAPSKYNLHTIPQNLLKHMHVHTHSSAAQPGKCVLLLLFFFPLSPICHDAFLHILAYLKNRVFQG